MRPASLRLLGLALLLGASLPTLTDAEPEPPFVSPELSAPGEVTFRTFAPNARSVVVEGLRGQPPAPMSRGANGVWSVTLKDLPADIYSYTFNVDGVMTLDRHNRYFKKWVTSQSAVEVNGTTPAIYSLQSVPHGIVHRHTYFSKTAGREISLQVYTPPGYNPRDRTRYPLIVLCHGTGDDETAWIEMGRAPYISDNLIAQGKMKKSVIVLPYGHPVPLPLIRPPEYTPANTAAMEKSVLSEVLPLVEANYQVTRRAEERAIVGLSMGGGHALTIGLTHLDVFRWVGGFSSAAPENNLDQRFASLIAAVRDSRKTPGMVWIGVGRDDDHVLVNENFTAWLREHKVPVTWRLTDGGHEWSVWREYFAEFAQAVFH